MSTKCCRRRVEECEEQCFEPCEEGCCYVENEENGCYSVEKGEQEECPCEDDSMSTKCCRRRVEECEEECYEPCEEGCCYVENEENGCYSGEQEECPCEDDSMSTKCCYVENEENGCYSVEKG